MELYGLKKRASILQGQGSKLYKNRNVDSYFIDLSQLIDTEVTGIIRELATLTKIEDGDYSGYEQVHLMSSGVWGFIKDMAAAAADPFLQKQEALNDLARRSKIIDRKLLELETKVNSVKNDYGVSINLY